MCWVLGVGMGDPEAQAGAEGGGRTRQESNSALLTTRGAESPAGRQGANVFTIPAVPSSPCSETKRSEGDVNSLPLAPTHAAGS